MDTQSILCMGAVCHAQTCDSYDTTNTFVNSAKDAQEHITNSSGVSYHIVSGSFTGSCTYKQTTTVSESTGGYECASTCQASADGDVGDYGTTIWYATGPKFHKTAWD
ncbi:MAG TPA: hypothetical protein VIM62_00370 [Acidobacteriaceae bacterium]